MGSKPKLKTARENLEMGQVGEMVRQQLEREFAALRQEQQHVFRLALKEAEALAWETPVPMLVFPMLAYEKLRSLDRWNRRQKYLRQKREQNEMALAA